MPFVRKPNEAMHRIKCKICGNQMPRDQFYRRKMRDGRIAYIHACRQCISEIGYKRRTRKYHHFIYVIRIDDTDYYKIGKTHDMKYRLEILQYHIPMPISIVHIHECDDAGLLELRLHRYYRRYRKRGEWHLIHNFSLPEMKAAIKRLSI